MEEMIDILDENGNGLREAKGRKEVHEKGYWHRVVQIFIINGDKILLQQRSLNKKADPGKWCASASGHISSGEKSLDAAYKEFSEELGIEIEKDKFKLVDSFKSPSARENKDGIIYNNHFVDLYFSSQTIDIEEVSKKIQKEEVAQIKFYKISEFIDMVNKKDDRLIDASILFEHVIKNLVQFTDIKK